MPGGCHLRGGTAPVPRVWPHGDSMEDGTGKSFNNYDQVSSILKFTLVYSAVNSGSSDRVLLFATLLVEVNAINKNVMDVHKKC